MAFWSSSWQNLQIQILQGRSSCSHSAWIVFSMDFLQTSPEWGVHNKTQLLCLLRCLCYWMTSKQSQKVVQGPKDYNCKFSLSFLKAKSLSFHSLTWIKPDRWKSGMQPQVSAFDSSICLVSAFHALEEEFQNLISDDAHVDLQPSIFLQGSAKSSS